MDNNGKRMTRNSCGNDIYFQALCPGGGGKGDGTARLGSGQNEDDVPECVDFPEPDHPSQRKGTAWFLMANFAESAKAVALRRVPVRWHRGVLRCALQGLRRLPSARARAR
eukprot:2079950-Pyramimonas_sp.AAC.3